MTRDSESPNEIMAFRFLLGESLTETSRNRWYAFCPFEVHQGVRRPFSVYPGRDDGRFLWRCALCGKKGVGVHTLAAEMQVSDEEAAQLHLIMPIEGSAVVDPVALVMETSARLMRDESALGYLLHHRCISREAVEALHLGIDPYGFYTFPSYDADGTVVCIKGRRWRQPQGWRVFYGKPALFGQDAIAKARGNGSELLVCLGEPDAAAARSAGYLSIGVPGRKSWQDEWSLLLAGLDVVVCFDKCATGVREAKAVAEMIYEYSNRVRIVQWPDVRKEGHDLTAELRDRAVAGIHSLVTKARVYTPSRGVTNSMGIDWTQTDHARVPLIVLRDVNLHPIDIVIYCELQDRLDRRGEPTKTTHSTIADAIGKERKTVLASFQRLEKAGYLRVYREPAYKKMANSYRLVV